MKRNISLILASVLLAVTMQMMGLAAPSLASISDNVLEDLDILERKVETAASASENLGYNSIKLPVVNEEDESKEDGKSAGLLEESAASLLAEAKIATITGIPAQTASKGSGLEIENVMSYLSNANCNIVSEFFRYNYYPAVIEFVKGGTTTTFYYEKGSYDNYYNSLFVPVPAELANGTYNVKVHSLGGDGYSEYTEVIFSFSLTVTNVDPGYNVYKLKTITPLADTTINMLEGNNEEQYVRLNKSLPDEAYCQGYAVAADGAMFPISGECDGEKIETGNGFDMLPAGTYNCYFHVADPYDWGNEAWQNFDFDVLYGPVKVNVTSLYFQNEYYYPSSSEQYTSLEFEKSVAKILSNVQDDGLTISLDFKNNLGASVCSMNDLAVDYFYVDYYEDQWYSYGYGQISFSLNLIGFDVGSYTVDVTLKDKNGVTYALGSAVMSVTDKTVINSVHIWNYDETLTNVTESFYVSLETSNIFLDYDKIDIYLLNPNGQIVAETVSRELKEASSYSGSELLYKLKVTQTLDVYENYSGGYTLDIRSPESIPLICTVDKVHIRVTSDPVVLRGEFIDPDVVKFYTENLPAGEYVVTDNYRLSSSNMKYTAVVNDNGIGTFQLNNFQKNRNYNFYLRDSESTGETDYIDYFNVYTSASRVTDRFSATPGFIFAGSTSIQNLSLTVEMKRMNITVQDIEYVRVVQNDVVVANVNNLSVAGRTYYTSDLVLTPFVRLSGNLAVVPGKSFVKGQATIEVKYNDGYVYTHTIPVTDASTGLYGGLSVDKMAYYYRRIGDNYSNYSVGTNKVSFTISGTNATAGTVSLYKMGTTNPIETLNLTKLTKTTSNSHYYTYKGTFNTVLSPDVVYTVKFTANNNTKSSSNFSYYSGKHSEQSENLTAFNGQLNIYLYGMLNISNPKAVTFKAVMGNSTYNLPVTLNNSGTDYASFAANTSSLPTGHFTLKAYEGVSEVLLSGTVSGYNFGNVTKPYTSGSGWYINKDNVSYRVFGVNLNKVDKASIEVYEVADFPEGDYYSKYKLRFVTSLDLAKPYNSDYIAIDSNLLASLETGSYVLVYVLDGVAVEADPVYVEGIAADNTVHVTDIFLDKSSAKLSVGQTLTLTATVAPNNATNKAVTWSSSDSSVATVENGVVTAKAAGTAKITATTVDGALTASCTVNVIIPVTSISLSQKEATLELDETLTLTAQVVPSNATDNTVIWSCSDNSVATVENGVVTPIAVGTATITAKAVDGGFKAECSVTVQDTRTTEAHIYTESDKKTVMPGSEFTVTVSVSGTYGSYYVEIPKAFDGFMVTGVVTSDGETLSDEGEKIAILSMNCLDRKNSKKIKIADVTVKVDDTAVLGEKEISFSKFAFYDFSQGYPRELDYTTSFATVEITNRLPGDINEDGVFNYYDVSRLYARYRGKATLPDSVENECIDINEDGVFNYYDVSRLYAIYRGKANFEN